MAVASCGADRCPARCRHCRPRPAADRPKVEDSVRRTSSAGAGGQPGPPGPQRQHLVTNRPSAPGCSCSTGRYTPCCPTVPTVLDHYDLAEHVLPLLQRLPEARFESVEADPDPDACQGRNTGSRFEISRGRRASAHRDHRLRSRSGYLSVQPWSARLRVPQRALSIWIASIAPSRRWIARVEPGEGAIAVFRDGTLSSRSARPFFLKVRDVVERRSPRRPSGRSCRRCRPPSPSASERRSGPGRRGASPIATPCDKSKRAATCGT